MPFTDPFVANPYPYAFAATLSSTTNPDAPYEIVENFVSGVYTISWSGGGTLTVDFYNGTSLIGTATGTSSITFNLAQSATKVVLWNTVAGVSVVISLTALAAAPTSGQLFTYTASGTPGLVGDAYCVLVGGGGGGAGTDSSGGSGGITGGRVNLIGTELLTIGAIGIGATTGLATSGGATTFAGFTAGGGGGANGGGIAGVAGTPNGGSGGQANGTAVTASAAASTIFSFFDQGTTGGGATPSQTAKGSGIGTGGATGGGNATGFGAGGGSNYGTLLGGNGTPGVCYIILVA